MTDLSTIISMPSLVMEKVKEKIWGKAKAPEPTYWVGTDTLKRVGNTCSSMGKILPHLSHPTLKALTPYQVTVLSDALSLVGASCLLKAELRDASDSQEGLLSMLNAAMLAKQVGSNALDIGKVMWPKGMESIAKNALGIGSKAYVGLEVGKLLVSLASNPSKVVELPKTKIKQD